MPTPAIFLDRDGTLIEQVHHLSKVEDVKVYDFTREALQLLTGQGFRCVIVTNQSAMGRGLLDEAGLNSIHEEMLRQVGQDNLIHGIYFCSLMPVSGDPRIVEAEDRKPGPGMLRRAAQELDLDLNNSWMIGDAISDMLAGRNAGCRGTVLVRTGYGRKTETEYSGSSHLTDSRASLLPTQGGEGGRRQDEGERGDRRFEDNVASSSPAIDHIADDLLAAARFIIQHDQC